MKSLSISVITPHQQPVPIMPPDGKLIRSANDFSCNDPRAYTDLPYVPRVYGTKYTIPQAHKYTGGDPQKMTSEWAELWYDGFVHYSPEKRKYQPANLNDGNDWSWLNGFVPMNENDKWWLHLIHSARCYDNKMSIPMPEYYDPITGFGSYTATKPFMKEAVTTANNYFWQSTGNNFWALDGTQPAPKFEQIKDMFFFLHISTQSTPYQLSATPSQECPNGTFIVSEFPQSDGNGVVHPIISSWVNGRTMEWNGLRLREGQLPMERYLAWPAPPEVTWPYLPTRPIIVTF